MVVNILCYVKAIHCCNFLAIITESIFIEVWSELFELRTKFEVTATFNKRYGYFKGHQFENTNEF